MTAKGEARAPVLSTDGRLRATYALTVSPGQSPEAKAAVIAFEQTVELPEDRVSEDLVRSVVGRVERLEARGEGTCLATISYSSNLVGGNFSQLMNLLYGNISLLSGIRLVAVEWPINLLEALPGPQFGMSGLRALCGVETRRPLTCAVAKPLGLSSRELANQVGRMARAGIDLIKDDHSLSDQPFAPFRERIGLCQEAVERANQSSGTTAIYLASVGGPGPELHDRLAFLRDTGCRGIVILPFFMGLDAVAELASESGLALLAHPSGSGALFGPNHGIAPDVYLGQILRIAGCDAVIYPHVGGRFRMDEPTAIAISSSLLSDLGPILPSAPAPGGSIEPSGLGAWLGLYGPDSVFVVGASVTCAEDPVSAAEELVARVHGANN